MKRETPFALQTIAAMTAILVLAMVPATAQEIPFKVISRRQITSPDGWDFHTRTANTSATVGFARYSKTKQCVSLCCIDIETRSETILLETIGNGDGAITWSPDDSRIAFDTRDPNDDLSEIWILDLATGEMTNFTNMEGNSFRPDWSPRGDKIVFTYQMYLFIKPLDGGPAQKISDTLRAWNAVWSPDGSTILYAQGKSGEQVSLCIMDADGSNQRILGRINGSPEIWPNWSPCGKYIVYNKYSGDHSGCDLVIHELASGEEMILSDDGDHRFPDWSADGRSIFFQKDEALWQIKLETK